MSYLYIRISRRYYTTYNYYYNYYFTISLYLYYYSLIALLFYGVTILPLLPLLPALPLTTTLCYHYLTIISFTVAVVIVIDVVLYRTFDRRDRRRKRMLVKPFQAGVLRLPAGSLHDWRASPFFDVYLDILSTFE